jgi:hypothetical protein
LRNILYVPGLEKNLVSISFLEEKGNVIAFVDGKLLSWSRDFDIENARVIGTCEISKFEFGPYPRRGL